MQFVDNLLHKHTAEDFNEDLSDSDDGKASLIISYLKD